MSKSIIYFDIPTRLESQHCCSDQLRRRFGLLLDPIFTRLFGGDINSKKDMDTVSVKNINSNAEEYVNRERK